MMTFSAARKESAEAVAATDIDCCGEPVTQCAATNTTLYKVDPVDTSWFT